MSNTLIKDITAEILAVTAIPATQPIPAFPGTPICVHGLYFLSWAEQVANHIISQPPVVVGHVWPGHNLDDSDIDPYWYTHGSYKYWDKCIFAGPRPAVPGSPGTPGVTGVPADYHTGWNAGARSIDSIAASGRYQFSVPRSVVGVITGLNNVNSSAGYAEIDFGLEFAGGRVRVIEGGESRTDFVAYATADVFTISRSDTFVRYYQNNVQIYFSMFRSTGSMFADCSLYYGGDSIVDASISSSVGVDFTEDAVLHGTFTDHIVDDQSVLERASFSATFSDIVSLGHTSSGGSVVDGIADHGDFLDYQLLPETIVEHGALTVSLSCAVAPAGIVQHGSFSDRLLPSESHIEYALAEETYYDNIDTGGATTHGGVQDGDGVETGIFSETLVAPPGTTNNVESGGLTDSFYLLVTDSHAESGTMSDAISIATAFDVEELGTFTLAPQTASSSTSPLINNSVEAGTLADQSTNQVTTTTPLVESGSFTQTQIAGLSSALVEHGSFSQASSQVATTVNNVVEHGAFAEAFDIEPQLLNAQTGSIADSQALSADSLLVQNGALTATVLQTIAATDNVVEHAAFTDALAVGFTNLLVEAGAFTPSERQNNDVIAESVTGTVSVTFGHINLVVENGAFTDAIAPALSNNLVEAGAFTVSRASTIASEYATSGAFADAQQVGFGNNVVVTGAFTPSVTQSVSATFVLESGSFSAASAFARSSLNVEHGTLAEDNTSTIVANNLLVERVFATEHVQGAGAPGAWHAPTDTFAMSQYTNYPFQSMAVVNGVLLGCGENGVYRLDANTDLGVAIDATITHDWLDGVRAKEGVVSDPHTKRPQYLYVGCKTAGQLGVSLGYVNGAESSVNYTMPLSDQLGFANNRVKLDNGIRSRYLKPTLRNVSGAAFNLVDAHMRVVVTDKEM